MSSFFVGQRVRIVRNLFPVKASWIDALTGTQAVIATIVSPPPMKSRPEFCIVLRGIPFVCFCAEELEPIIDQHEPCESEFKESLDKLLEGLPV